MKQCIICQKEIDGTYGSGKYCSRSCSNTRKHDKTTKSKISKSVSKYLLKRGIAKRQKTYSNIYLIKCEWCNTRFYRQYPNRRFCSRKCVCAYIGSKPKKDTSKMGGPRDGGGRSKVYEYTSWLNEAMKLNNDEIRVAKVLDLLKLNWKRNWTGFKYTTLKGKKRKYYPDFYIKDKNVYIEYKGWITKETVHKMNDAVAKNKFKLIIIYSDDKRYSKLGLSLSELEKNHSLLQL